MNTYRKTAVIVGILFIACTVTSILGMSMAHSFLDAPDYLTKLAANGNQVVTASLLEFIWAATAAGIAIGLYPLLKRFNETLALGSVAFRIIESVPVIIGTISLLSLLVLSRDFLASGAPDASSFQASGALLLGMRDWAHSVIAIIAFNLGAFMYYCVLYRSGLVPRWLSGWGLIGVVLSLAATLIGAFNHDFLTGSINTILNTPIGLQEMVLAAWLIIKGFNKSALASLPAVTAVKRV
jgi:hypothetical protein